MNTKEICAHAEKAVKDKKTLNDNPFNWLTETAKYTQWKAAYCEAKRGK